MVSTRWNYSCHWIRGPRKKRYPDVIAICKCTTRGVMRGMVETRLIVAERFEKLSEIPSAEGVTRELRSDSIFKRNVNNFESCHLLHLRRCISYNAILKCKQSRKFKPAHLTRISRWKMIGLYKIWGWSCSLPFAERKGSISMGLWNFFKLFYRFRDVRIRWKFDPGIVC